MDGGNCLLQTLKFFIVGELGLCQLVIILHLHLEVQDAAMHGSLPFSIVDLGVGAMVLAFFQLVVPGGGSFEIMLDLTPDVLGSSLLVGFDVLGKGCFGGVSVQDVGPNTLHEVTLQVKQFFFSLFGHKGLIEDVVN